MCLTGLPSRGDASLQVPPFLGGDLKSPAPQVSYYLHSNFLAAEVKERTERRSQSVVRWRAVEAHFTQHCCGLVQCSA